MFGVWKWAWEWNWPTYSIGVKRRGHKNHNYAGCMWHSEKLQLREGGTRTGRCNQIVTIFNQNEIDKCNNLWYNPGTVKRRNTKPTGRTSHGQPSTPSGALTVWTWTTTYPILSLEGKAKLRNSLLTNSQSYDIIRVQSNDGNERRTATATHVERLLDIP